MSDVRDNSGVLERKLATILSADVAEFSRLMGEDEEQTLRTFRGHKQVFESLVAMHRGRIFNTAGDAILAEFGSAVEAVRCATDIQAALRTRNDQLPPSRQVRFRIGINLGDVMVHGQDLLGDGVNVARAAADGCRARRNLYFRERSRPDTQQTVALVPVARRNEFQEHPAAGPNVLHHGSRGPRRASHSEASWHENRFGKMDRCWLAAVGATGRRRLLGLYRCERNKAEPARAIAAEVRPKSPVPEVSANPSVEKLATEQPVPTVSTVRPASEPKPGAAETPRQTISPAPAPRRASAAAPSAVSAGPYVDCTPEKFAMARLRTSQRDATAQRELFAVRKSPVSGRPREAGNTMILTGDVARSGDVKIGMHSETPDGTVVVVIDLTGTLHDGLITASGTFRKGRTATLNWQKISREPVERQFY